MAFLFQVGTKWSGIWALLSPLSDRTKWGFLKAPAQRLGEKEEGVQE